MNGWSPSSRDNSAMTVLACGIARAIAALSVVVPKELRIDDALEDDDVAHALEQVLRLRSRLQIFR
ncbi:hypothetical protein ACRAVF_22840 [Bradyrhizobium oligotrophicum S58]